MISGASVSIPARFAFEVTAQVASALEAAYNYVPGKAVSRFRASRHQAIERHGDSRWRRKASGFRQRLRQLDSERLTQSHWLWIAGMAPEHLGSDAPMATFSRWESSMSCSRVRTLTDSAARRSLLRQSDERLALSLRASKSRHEARKVMRLMMDYDAENRPTGGQVELMEVLAPKTRLFDASVESTFVRLWKQARMFLGKEVCRAIRS